LCRALGIIADNAHGPAQIKVFAPLLIEKAAAFSV
jgi:hypothetical protein